jgi:hypothetical protein
MDETNNFKTDHVNHDSAICLTPGLFTSFPKGKRGKVPLFVVYKTTDEIFTFRGPYILGVTEMRALQGLAAIAPICGNLGNNKIELSPTTSSDVGIEHRQTLDLSGNAVNKTSLVVSSSFYALSREIGYSNTSFHSGYRNRLLRDAMERLWTTTCVIENIATGIREGCNLLSRYQSTKGNFTVALNIRIAETILGINKKYTRIDMAEIRALKTDPARLMHQRLCGWIDPGKTGKITLEALCDYVWGETAFNPNTLKTRRQAVRKALVEFKNLGWTINEYVEGKFNITRRGIPN